MTDIFSASFAGPPNGHVNNQYVEAGTLLVELDPNDYQVAVEQAPATLVEREGFSQCGPGQCAHQECFGL